MRTTRRSAPVLVAGAVLAAAAGACTPRGEEPPPDPSPAPLPTSFEGDRPPGVGPEPVRYLHGPGGQAPGLLGEPGGVRITAFGGSFLVSSNAEERHMVQRASDGEVLWEGEARVDGFAPGPEPGGPPVLRTGGAGGAGGTVLDDRGEVLWEGGEREVYLSGLVVRRPEGWTPDDPYGGFEVEDPDGERLWEYEFTGPAEAGGPEEEAPGGGAEDGAAEDGGAEEGGGDSAPPSEGALPEGGADPDRHGVPVGAVGGALLLDDGAGLLQARAAGEAPEGPEGEEDGGAPEPGDLLWSFAGDDPGLLGADTVPRPRPQVLGAFPIPAEEGGEDASPEEAEATGDGAGDAPERDAVLVRWSLPEEPSLLAMHDARTGEIAWTLPEPGANPAPGDFAPPDAAGDRFDAETGTLLLPQASGEVPLIAVDVADGEELWEFREDEAGLSPAFAAGGYVYGDARGTDEAESPQVVLEAATMDVAAEGLDSYVEAVTDDGYAMVVHDRQRFVFAPGPDGG
ncbi:hypothetical protein [Nocardiopsis potens]|uniref:hypothetical protein n=1 Tax=Nocardiopsis potens TaxID=1246458 RepID=UPI00034C7E47|nr:hypothetical protein [Nocardiopsis potens]